MSNVIHVLTQMGSDANCQSEEAIKNLLGSAELEFELTEAISNKDVTSLERQLEVRTDIVCGVFVPDEEEQTNTIAITNKTAINF